MWFHVCTRQKLLLVVALNDSQALWLAFGFCQKQKQLKGPTKGTLSCTSGGQQQAPNITTFLHI
jgi:hypothetical protein